ncbi:MAG TPA: hypothetical protein VGJ40_01790 [Gaiellaceae bacterium]|jgi:hypothetical protein
MTRVTLDADVLAELVGRLTSLQKLAADLTEAYDDPVAKKGAREMLASVERLLRLLEQSQ